VKGLMMFNDRITLLLQPLRVPAGWKVTYNQFYRIDPKELLTLEDSEHKKNLVSYLEEDMFQAVHEKTKISLDLGWGPAGDLYNGRFRATLVKPCKPDLEHMPWHEREYDYDWDNPLEQLQTETLEDAISFLETSMQNTTNGKYGLSLSCFISDSEKV
jgi:hypothetical protein